MDLEQMIAIEKAENIKSLLITLVRSKNNITLWQNIDNIHRLRKSVFLHKFDVRKEELIFLPRKGLFKFSSQIPIYFFAKNKNAIFKHSIFYNSQMNLVIKRPDLMMLNNSRKSDRENVYDSGQMVSLLLENDGNKGAWFKAKLIDRSEDGFSFKSTLSNVIRFKPDQVLEYKFEEMAKFQKGRIVNVSTIYGNKNERFYKVSMKKLIG